MRQFHIFFNLIQKLDIGLLEDFCVFTCFYQVLHDVIIKLFGILQIKTNQFYYHIMQKLVKTGKYTEINKQSYVKFWLDWRNMELSHIHLAVQERIIFYWIERDAKLIYIVWPTFIFTMKIRQKNLNLRNIWSFQSYGKYSWFGQLQRQFVKLLEVWWIITKAKKGTWSLKISKRKWHSNLI